MLASVYMKEGGMEREKEGDVEREGGGREPEREGMENEREKKVK